MVEKGVQVHKTKTTKSQLSEHYEHILPLGLREYTRGLGNTTHGGCRVLHSGGLNHSKSLCTSRIHSPLDRALLDCPQAHPTLRIMRVQSATRLEKSSDKSFLFCE